MKTSMKSILERFLKAPYGFVEADVQWLVAKLFKDGEIAMFVNNEAVTLLSKSEEEIIRYLESVVKNVNDVLKKPSPYFEIFKLPELLDKFISLYGSLLKETQKPIDIAISDARQRVFEDLKDKKCHDKLVDKYIRLFQEISDKANHCANIADLQNIKLEADALKVRCLNEINKEEAKIIEEEQSANNAGNNDTRDTDTPAVPVRPVKKKKTVSIKSINNAATWQIENEEDIKKYLDELKTKLMATLEEDTIINIEF